MLITESLLWISNVIGACVHECACTCIRAHMWLKICSLAELSWFFLPICTWVIRESHWCFDLTLWESLRTNYLLQPFLRLSGKSLLSCRRAISATFLIETLSTDLSLLAVQYFFFVLKMYISQHAGLLPINFYKCCPF